MKLPPVSWAFFFLAVFVLAGYVLNRGIYIGSGVDSEPWRNNAGQTIGTWYTKNCHYLLWNDVRKDCSTSSNKRYEAEDGFCSPLPERR
jgi:hypothetical protein